MEYLNLLTTTRGAFCCATMAFTSLLLVMAPIDPKRSAGMGASLVDSMTGALATFFGFLAIGHWCLPEGTRLFETAAVLCPLGAALAYRGRKRLWSLAADPERFRRTNLKLKVASWVAFPVSLALMTYTTLIP